MSPLSIMFIVLCVLLKHHNNPHLSQLFWQHQHHYVFLIIIARQLSVACFRQPTFSQSAPSPVCGSCVCDDMWLRWRWWASRQAVHWPRLPRWALTCAQSAPLCLQWWDELSAACTVVLSPTSASLWISIRQIKSTQSCTFHSNLQLCRAYSYFILCNTLIGAFVRHSQRSPKEQCSVQLRDHTFRQIWAFSAKTKTQYKVTHSDQQDSRCKFHNSIITFELSPKGLCHLTVWTGSFSY